ncbi:threonine ammonia-lyase [Zavarzinia compransoris]|uniref:L-serine dehydratase n=1 Tax=Zavarzinia compransoris TaxID=1264899 RepID=A0A317EA21_9PROT|nr:threonine ammonia-lyase [Zavarzinia compransoris]PWR23402.1 threonine ammonia-lyase [Zavarzinia compransoris]TDP46023.1 L-threonine ammonia-lyase [Zavarzinia compransoris]
MTTPAITIADIHAAAAALAGQIIATPCAEARTLSQITGARLFLKFENHQFTASFKDRGACNKLQSLGAEERKAGVIAMSAGNHAQGVAYHAARLGIPATIVMPRTTPFVKVRQTRDHGARVVLEGEMLAGAFAAAQRIAADKGLVMIHPFDDPFVIAGQGTVGLEMLAAVPDLEVLVVPIGGGGLIAGIATAAKTLNPAIRVIGVEAALYPSMYNALRGTAEVCGGMTIAEGIAVKEAGQLTRAIARDLVDDILLVTEADLERAIGLLLAIEKTVVEGAGAAGLAAVMAHPALFAGRRTGIVLSGGNIDPRLLGEVIRRNLVREGRIAGLRVQISDSPGTLATIATLVGEAGGNILDVSHQRLFLDVPVKNTDLDLVIETRDAEHLAEIIARIEAAGYPVRRLSTTAD